MARVMEAIILFPLEKELLKTRDKGDRLLKTSWCKSASYARRRHRLKTDLHSWLRNAMATPAAGIAD